MPNSEAVRASCLCGRVTWAASHPFEQMIHCHCSMCRKSHGAPFATYVAAPATGFQLDGEENIASFAASDQVTRRFCHHCGSTVPSPVADGRAFVPAGNLQADPETRPIAHVFVASKAPWYPLPDDGLPRHDTQLPGMPGTPIERTCEAASEPGWVHGSCLCGDIAFELAHGGWTLMQCHCSRCRRARSAAHGGNLFADTARFRWLRGQAELRTYKLPEAARYAQAFCGRCGSAMPRPAPPRFVVPASALDADPGITTRHHIFTAFKAPWFEIRDAIPQHEALPPSV